MSKFSVGSEVYLNSGSPVLTVVGFALDEITVTWFADGELQQMTSPAVCFTPRNVVDKLADVARAAFTQAAGNASFTEKELCQEVDRQITEHLKSTGYLDNQLDGGRQITVTATTTSTPAKEGQGYSWWANVSIGIPLAVRVQE